MLPPPFIEQMRLILGGSALESFLHSLQEPAPVSIRLNPAKTPDQIDLLAAGQTVQVPWHPDGRYLSQRPTFTLDPAFQAGAYYVQEASSMFVYQAVLQHLDFESPKRVLDLCAAPGGKSTLLASMMGGQGLLVANETIRTRTGALRENLEKWGFSNIAVTSAEVEEFAALENWFDLVLADAPCSGEGLFRKDPDAVREWSPDQVVVCAARQKRILAAAVDCLKPGGLLLYSTCTYNSRENGDNAAWLASEFNLEPLPIRISSEWGIREAGTGYQFFPHLLRGEGFYLAAFRKKAGRDQSHSTPTAFKSINALPKSQTPQLSDWLKQEAGLRYFQTANGNVIGFPGSLEQEYLVLDKYLKSKWFGTALGVFKGKDFVPDHGLAMSLDLSEKLPAVNLTLEQALRFLKKETFDLPPGTPQGWILARYRQWNLGWIKALPNRMNNYLPPERRIRMDIQQS